MNVVYVITLLFLGVGNCYAQFTVAPTSDEVIATKDYIKNNVDDTSIPVVVRLCK